VFRQLHRERYQISHGCWGLSMLKFLISAFFCTYAAAALCGTIDFKKTKANVTYEASTFWLGGIGPRIFINHQYSWRN
jgi:hypothetical protein